MQLQQPQSLDCQTNPSMQPVQGSTSAMQQNNLNNLQHNSLSGVPAISNSQPHMINTVQPGSSVDLGQVNSLNSLQQVATGSLSSQSGTNPVQENVGPLQQMLQNQKLTQQCNKLQKLFQLQQALQQQTALLTTDQMSQLHQMRQQMGMKTGVLQQWQSVGRLVGSHHSQLQSGISAPQFHQAPSPQWKEKEKVEGDATLPMEFEPYTSTVEAPLDSSAQTGNANGADWQEEVYQKIKSMRETYLTEINDLYQKIASAIQQRPQHEKIEKLKMFKMTLERIVLFLRLNKHEIQLSHKEKLFSVERHIRFCLSYKRLHKPTSSPLQGQLTSQVQNTYAHHTPTMDSGGQDIASEFDRLLSLID